MNRKAISAIVAFIIVLSAFIYQHNEISEARSNAVGQYKTHIYHLERLNRIMLETIQSNKYDDELLITFSNRSIDLGIVAYDLHLSANNYYIRLESAFLELADRNEELIKEEIIFLLESLQRAYELIYDELRGKPTQGYKKLYGSTELLNKVSNLLAEEEWKYYKGL